MSFINTRPPRVIDFEDRGADDPDDPQGRERWRAYVVELDPEDGSYSATDEIDGVGPSKHNALWDLRDNNLRTTDVPYFGVNTRVGESDY